MKKKSMIRGLMGLLASGMMLTSGLTSTNVYAKEKEEVATIPVAPPNMEDMLNAIGNYGFPIKLSPDKTPGENAWMPIEYNADMEPLNWMETYGNDIDGVWKEWLGDRNNLKTYPKFEDFYQAKTGHTVPVWVSSATATISQNEKYQVQAPTYKQHRYDRIMGYDEFSHTRKIESIPILRWELAHYPAQCVHTGGGFQASYGGWNGDGSTYVRETANSPGVCHRPYYSGMRAICAYCGQDIANGQGWLMYMRPETAERISVVDAGRQYIFVCPYDDCKHLEQGSGPLTHECIANSQNKYYVVYRTSSTDTNDDVFQEFIVDTVVKPDGTTIAEYEGVNNPEAEVALLTANNLKGSNKFFDAKGVGYEVDYFQLVDAGNNPINSINMIDAYGNTVPHSGRFECGEVLYNQSNALNLSVNEGDKVYMMAVWKTVQSALVIDPNGGSYTDGKSYDGMNTYSANGKYVVSGGNSKLYWVNGSVVDAGISGGKLSAPSTAYSVTFDCDPDNSGNGQRYVQIGSNKYYRTGGGSLPSVKSNSTFESWSVGKYSQGYLNNSGFAINGNGQASNSISSAPESALEMGTMSGEAYMNKGGATTESPLYRFSSANSNTVDYMRANWTMEEVTLPNAYWPHKNDDGVDIVEQCMGWYTDPSCDPSTFYGAPGDKKVPDRNIKVYAKFGVLTLDAVENYVANNKKGASDLYWNDSYNGNYFYSVFQTNLDTGVTSKIDIKNLNGETEANDISEAKRSSNGKVTVKESGAYCITLAGANGGWFHRSANPSAGLTEATFKGGDGALLKVDVALKKGDIINYYPGKNGNNQAAEASGWSAGGKPTGTSGSLDTSMGAAGGGATRVVITRNGNAIYDFYAGGGGGANMYGNGANAYTKLADGRFVTNVGDVTGIKSGDHYGENGVAGGGGGYFGGKAATYTLHTHVPGVCPEHDHKVNGCTGQYEGECGSTDWREVPGTYRHAKHYGGGPRCKQCGNGACAFSDSDVWATYHPGTPFGTPSWCDICGAEEWGHALGVRTYECANCGTRVDCEDHGYPEKCTAKVMGHWDCGEERYLCGLKIDSATQSFGGTSMAMDMQRSKVMTLASCTLRPASDNQNASGDGDGYVTIKLVESGAIGDCELKNVPSKDNKAPNAIIVNEDDTYECVANGLVDVTWFRPQDNGTPYRYKVQAHSVGTGNVDHESNYDDVLLVTGIDHYEVVRDTNATNYQDFNGKTVASVGSTGIDMTKNYLGAESCTVQVQILKDGSGKSVTTYLHVRAVDVAGNKGPATVIKIDPKEMEGWAVQTGTMSISSKIPTSAVSQWTSIQNQNYTGSERGNVYAAAANKTYYVRADGKTPFLLYYPSVILGDASDGYQINRNFMVANNGSQTQNIGAVLSMTNKGADGKYASEKLGMSRYLSNKKLFGDFNNAGAWRFNNGISNGYYQAIVAPAGLNGQTIFIYPRAQVDYDNNSKVEISDDADDRSHGLYVIPDAEPPVISGLDVFEVPEGTRVGVDGSDAWNLDIGAIDVLSGLRKMTVTVTNVDGNVSRSYTAGADGHVRIDMRSDTFFRGNISVEVRAIDNVGNEIIISKGADAIDLQTELVNAFNGTKVVPQGGKLRLKVDTYGYMDYIVITIPSVLDPANPGYPLTYTYPVKDYLQEDYFYFDVPTDAAEGPYKIHIQAFKGPDMLETDEDFEIKGNILDDVKVRIQ